MENLWKVSLSVLVVGTLLVIPSAAPAETGTPPEIVGILSTDTTIEPGESRTYDVAVTGVDDPATATFSGTGLTASVLGHRGNRLRLVATADIDAPPGARDLTITNPDGLSDTYPDAALVLGDGSPAVGDVAGFVFLDSDGDGVADGDEVGLADVAVSVTDATGAQWMASTGEQGEFDVAGVGVGDASVAVTAPSGFVLTTGNASQVVAVTDGGLGHIDDVGYEPADVIIPGVYDAGDVHFMFDARSLNLGDGATVDSWFDDVAGFELVPPDPGDAPTYRSSTGFEGVSSVEFDGVDDTLQVAFGELDTGDFVFHLVLETLTYSHRTIVMSRHAAGSIENKHVLAYDDYDEDRTLRGEPAWVVMSGPNGTQAEHYHPILSTEVGEQRNSPADDVTDAAHRVVITYVVRDSGQIRVWDRLDDVLDKTMAAPGNDLDVGLRLGSREDANPSSYGHFRIAFFMAVDESGYTESDLLDAVRDLGSWFNVPGVDES